MILGLVLLACEMITPGTFFFMFLGISGLVTGIAAYLLPDMPGWMPWLLGSRSCSESRPAGWPAD